MDGVDGKENAGSAEGGTLEFKIKVVADTAEKDKGGYEGGMPGLIWEPGTKMEVFDDVNIKTESEYLSEYLQ